MSRLVAAAQEVLDGTEGRLTQEERRFLLQGSSMGGARPKANVLHDGRLCLAKLPASGDRFDNARVEMALSDLARSAGIETPRTELISLPDGRGVFLSERFDRVPVPDKHGAFFRKGFLSALTLLGLDERKNPLGSCPAIADAARKAGIDCGRDIFRRMAFNMAIRNTDDHLRNHGFLRGKKEWRLSPAYNLMPAPAVPGVATSFDLSIGVGKMGRKATLENALSESARFGLPKREAEEIFKNVVDNLRSWRSVMARYGVTDSDIEKFSGSFFAR
ncbi:MAG: HipA domain-containing protein [Nitrospirae bacterium]|nr:HipA domain-containing protein [Nitrospirota bacterium]MCL5285476.1 HipA domain-containing protein [Nitrospirota bacterium]